MSNPNLLQTVLNAAKRTFARSSCEKSGSYKSNLSPEDFQSSLTELKGLLDTLAATDVGLDHSEALHNSASAEISQLAPPVTYIKIHEDFDVSIGIFVVRSGCK